MFHGSATSADLNNTFQLNANAAIAVDASSGKILYDQYGSKQGQGIASITKLLTVYMVYKNIAEGKLEWSDKVKPSDYAYNLTQDPAASNIQMVKGESFTVQDLVNACLLPSANSAAITLAEKIGGTEPKFVDQMKQQLKQWGITDEVLINSSGLNNSDLPQAYWYPGTSQDSENTMSAKDVATIAIHLIKDFPDVLNITNKPEIIFDKGGNSETMMENTDYMLPGKAYSFSGVDGLKTGTTALAGTCFVATANQNGFRVITVVLGADESVYGENSRFTETQALMENVYSHWKIQTLVTKGQSIKKYTKINITDGKSKTTNLVADANLSIPVIDNETPGYQFNKVSENLIAPIKKGEQLTKVILLENDRLGYLNGFQEPEFSLVAQKSVQKENSIILFFKHLINKASS
ncbi:MAG TPA: serine hydrolase [Lactovum miscens]